MDDIIWLNRGITTDRTKPWDTCANCGVKVQGAHTCAPENVHERPIPVLASGKARKRVLGRGIVDSMTNAGLELEN